ncbi:MAG: ATP-binding cassette domain-containing protein [Clostridiales bacterium]|jgi:osmoprotectant transport system ATP-binding protein|nr:ATP-binding cassette domain-containing protein [Clostridiales bacterium]
MVINIENLTKTYDGKVKILDGLNLSVSKGELITILGPSGCGKTTLLKIVNKLIEYDTGKVEVKDKDLREWDTIELRRNTGYVIQQIGLFPHMTIEDNISYVLSLQNIFKDDRRKKAEELIKMVGMDERMLKRYPIELSGGQNQRIGVARALAAEPDIILMDEPFGAVDEIARTALQDEFIKLHENLRSTIMFVTHDILEALKLGDRIVLMNHGKIEQVGTREELIFKPANQFVKDFIGIKGFKSSLDDQVIEKLYDKLIKNEITMEQVYSNLRNE